MREQLVEFLRRIPQSNEDAQLIEMLIDDLPRDVALGYSLLLETIGMIKRHDSGEIQATSQTAKYMLNSLASYVEQDLRWIDDWHTRGVFRLDEQNALQNGATLLYLLEQNRLAEIESPTPSREEEVAQVLIKRTNPETGAAELLMQYDRNADEYGLIGGRRGDDDASIEATMIREIEEELADHLQHPEDYQLELLISDLPPEMTLSPTFGALTHYRFWVYQATHIERELTLADGDVWSPIDEILKGYVTTPEGSVSEFHRGELYHLIDRHLAGGLMGIADSFK